MFSDGRNAIMYDRRGFKRDTDIGGWNRRCNVMQSCSSGHLHHIGFLDLSLVPYEDEGSNVLLLATLIEHAAEVKGLMGLNACCHDQPYDPYYLIRDADAWSRELDFEFRHLRGPAHCQLGLHDTELIALPQCGR